MSKSVDAEVDATAKEEMQRRLTTLVDCIDVERCNSMPLLEMILEFFQSALQASSTNKMTCKGGWAACEV